MRDKILIGCILCLFSFIPKGTANNYIMNPYTHQEISADSIIERVMTFAPLYETIVSDYRANLYIKGTYDRDEVAAALDRALTMSLAERISRHAEMLDVIVKNDINHWQECFISDLKQIVPRSAESQQRDKVATFPKLA